MPRPSIDVTMDGLDDALELYAKAIGSYADEVLEKLDKSLSRAGRRWKSEAKQRVPKDTGTLHDSIDVYYDRTGNEFVLEVYSDEDHAVFTEFGTAAIAGGAVLALGSGPDVDDTQAVKSWPALEERGEVGSGQQMPWLRTSFRSVVLPQLERDYRRIMESV